MFLFVSSIIVFVVTLVAFMVFVGLWTYNDAKKKSEHPPWLWVVIVLFVSNLIGFVLYLVIGRTKRDVVASGRFKKLAIASVIGLALGTTFFTISTVHFATNFDAAQARHFGSFTALEDSVRDGVWTVSAERANGYVRLTPVLSAEELQSITASSLSSDGGVVLRLEQMGEVYFFDITNMSIGPLYLRRINPGRVTIILEFENTENVSAAVSWR